MLQSKKIINFWFPVIFWAALIFILSSRQITPVSDIYLKDFIVKKTAHIVEYGILTVFLYRALKESGVRKREAGIYSVVLATFYGITDEFHQSFTPGRDPQARDVFFDTIGSVAAIYFIWRLLPKAPRRLKRLAKKYQIL
ncbi:VanZ family protein [Patescibacteria group bacterium]|nr:VanZ family protein [Patescibacteria group bacterium]